jgi:hypothetical protein
MTQERADLPLLLSMLLKVMAKGHEVRVVETHRTWCGPVVEATPSTGTPGAIDVKVRSEDALTPELTSIHSFTIRQAERWKLGRNEAGQWCLWPPRAKSRS